MVKLEKFDPPESQTEGQAGSTLWVPAPGKGLEKFANLSPQISLYGSSRPIANSNANDNIAKSFIWILLSVVNCSFWVSN